jgi:hypothetical protein
VNDLFTQDERWTSYDMSAAADYENAMRVVRQPGNQSGAGVLVAAELVRYARSRRPVT